MAPWLRVWSKIRRKDSKKSQIKFIFARVRVTMTEYIDLYTLQAEIHDGISGIFPDSVWVKAEIGAFNVTSSGHCYLDFVQKEGNATIAKSRAVIWRSKFPSVKSAFESETGVPLSLGLEILVRVRVTYHALYGFLLVVEDVNPEFTLGLRARQRQQTIERLGREGLMDLQKELVLPVLPYSLAVVSSPTAAGYGDFRKHLLENQYGYAYHIDLYEALMQGETAPSSMIAALTAIADASVSYDAVLILRGGGSEFDLDCFDDYALAVEIARFPLPVFTAIGHERDYHVADMVANTHVKTPTALADLFLECSAAEDERISSLDSRLREAVSHRLALVEERLAALGTALEAAFRNRLQAMERELDGYGFRLGRAFSNRVYNLGEWLESCWRHISQTVISKLDLAESRLQFLEMKITTTDPRGILDKGYSLTTDANGVKFTRAALRSRGDRISILMPDGKLRCTVDKVELN